MTAIKNDQMPNCFELFSFLFVLGPPSLRIIEGGVGGQRYSKAWLLKVEAALDSENLFVGQTVCVCCSVLQCVAVCCSVLPSVAVCCIVLQCAAVCCSVLPCVAVCFIVLQCVAVTSCHSAAHILPVARTDDSFISDDSLICDMTHSSVIRLTCAGPSNSSIAVGSTASVNMGQSIYSKKSAKSYFLIEHLTALKPKLWLHTWEFFRVHNWRAPNSAEISVWDDTWIASKCECTVQDCSLNPEH